MDIELVNVVKNQVINELKKEYFLVKKTNDFKPDTKLKNKMFILYAIEVVCEFYKVNKTVLFSGSRDKDSVNVRRIVSLLCREVCKHPIPYAQIGVVFHKDHSTMMYAYKEVINITSVDKRYKEEVDTIKEMVKNSFFKELDNFNENNNEQKTEQQP
jgi:chromosomal replication initiation ATPase DnaA